MIDIDVFIAKCEKDIDYCFANLAKYAIEVEALVTPKYNATIKEWEDYNGAIYLLHTCLRDNLGEIKHLQGCIESAEIMRTQMTQWKTVESQSKKFDARVK
jgi:hypothetical protein